MFFLLKIDWIGGVNVIGGEHFIIFGTIDFICGSNFKNYDPDPSAAWSQHRHER